MMVYIETMTFVGGSVDGYIERGSETERVCTQETRTMYICTGQAFHGSQGDSKNPRETPGIPGRLQGSQGDFRYLKETPWTPAGLQGSQGDSRESHLDSIFQRSQRASRK